MNIKKCIKNYSCIENEYKCTSRGNIEGTTTFWCKKCNNLVNAKIKIDSYFSIVYENNPDIIYYCTPEMKCCKCNNNMIELDPNIANAIVKLNNKGYTTKFCCEGYHSDTDVNSYIYFDINIRKYVEDYNLESPWYIDERYSQGYVIRADIDYDNVELIFKKLYEWVDRLPNIKEI